MEHPVEVLHLAQGFPGAMGRAVEAVVWGGNQAAVAEGPVHVGVPVLPVGVALGAEQHDGHRRILGGLNQGETFKQLIKGAETAR